MDSKNADSFHSHSHTGNRIISKKNRTWNRMEKLVRLVKVGTVWPLTFRKIWENIKHAKYATCIFTSVSNFQVKQIGTYFAGSN